MLTFEVSQHSRDPQVMERLQKILGCGVLYVTKKPDIQFRVVKFSDIVNIVIPFFEKYPLQGSKRWDFEDFCKISKLMEEKLHLTPSGLEQIKSILSGMNRKRV